jgi:hypothetical protein
MAAGKGGGVGSVINISKKARGFSMVKTMNAITKGLNAKALADKTLVTL